MKKQSKKIWDYLNGKKTKIGTALHAVGFIASFFLKENINETQQIVYHAIVGNITGVGIVHKFGKMANSNTGKKIINFISKIYKK